MARHNFPLTYPLSSKTRSLHTTTVHVAFLVSILVAHTPGSLSIRPTDSLNPAANASFSSLPSSLKPPYSSPSYSHSSVSQHSPSDSAPFSSSSSSADTVALSANSKQGSTSRRRLLPFSKWRNRLQGRWNCQTSTMSGYTSMKVLEEGLILHWTATTGTQLSVAVEAKRSTLAANGWFAVGWSANGMMPGGIAVAKESFSYPTTYDLIGHTDAVQASEWQVYYSNISPGPNGGFVMQFTKVVNDNAPVTFKTARVSHVIYAYGYGTNVQSHTGAGSVSINFSCGCGILFWKCGF